MKRINKQSIEDIFALTPMQEGMLFHYLKDPGSNQYFEQLHLDISGQLDIEIFKRSWDFVIDANEMLRAVFRWEKIDNPVQVILKKHTLQLRYHDLPDENRDTGNKLLFEDIKDRDLKDTFDLREVPFRVTLCKIEENSYKVIISNHHILYDGWSSGIILGEFFKTYNDLCCGKQLIKPVKTKFKEFTRWIRNQDPDKQDDFWKRCLAGFTPSTELPIKIKKRGTKKKTCPGTFHMRFEEETTGKIEDFAKKNKVTLAAFFYSAWGILLQRYNNCRDVVFATTVSGRRLNIKGVEDMVGLFINTIPLRAVSRAGEQVGDFVSRINHSLQAREAYESTPLVNIMKYIESGSGEFFFDTVLVIENYPLDKPDNYLQVNREKNRITLNSYSMVETTNYDFLAGISMTGEISIDFYYNQEVFAEESVLRLASHFHTILEDITGSPGKKIHQIELLPGEERRRVLLEFNNTGVGYPGDKALHQLFEEQAEKTPGHTAVIGEWQSGVGGKKRLTAFAPGKRTTHITYGELDRRASQVANFLRAKEVRPGAIAAIMLERSPEMIIGILGILKAGNAYLPIDPEYPEERISFMMRDSRAPILLTGIQEIDEPYNYNTEGDGSPGHGGDFSLVNLAYIIYTSGSTGKPRGVMVEHKNVIAYLNSFQDEFKFTAKDTVIQLASYSFDAFVEEVYPVLLAGGKVAIPVKETLRDISLLSDFIKKNNVTIVDCTPLLLNELNNRAVVHSFPSVRTFISGGDLLKGEYIDNLLKSGEVYNTYGPTEATVCATYYKLPGGLRGNIPIGKPFSNYKLYILTRSNQLQPIGVPGELCISGGAVTRGYLNHPELTADKFKRVVVGHSSLSVMSSTNKRRPGFTGDRLYHTGDLSRWQPDGNVEFLGRIDRQVKIRGFRIELEEIEDRLLAHDEIKEAVVLSGEEKDGEKYVCAYIVTGGRGMEPSSITAEVRHYLSKSLPGYMVPAYVIQLDAIPLTIRGKIDTRALPGPGKRSGDRYIAPRDEIEQKLVGIWSTVLHLEPGQIGIDDDFFSLGGHSLKAFKLNLKLHKEMNAKVPLEEIFETPTIRGLARYIRGLARERFVSIEPGEKMEYYTLSPEQQRMYVLQQMNEMGTAYNMSAAWELKGTLDKNRLENTFEKLIRRYESLRTSFKVVREKSVQVIHDELDFEIENYDSTHDRLTGTPPDIINRFIRPFDLSRPPLLRVGLTREEDKKCILMVDMHHIISDGVSVDILVKELIALYKCEELPGIRIQYKDFSQWQNKALESGELKKQEAYWLNRFKDEIPVLEMPVDNPVTGDDFFAGANCYIELDRQLIARVRDFVLETRTTSNILLMAVYFILLSKYTGQDDIIVGSAVVGRTHEDLKKIIGLFFNLLAIRNYPQRHKTAAEFLEEVKENTIQALANQSYPFIELVRKLGIERQTGRHPLFDTLFTMQNLEMKEPELPGLEIKPLDFEPLTTKFKLYLDVIENKESLGLLMKYSTALYEAGAVKQILEHYIEILKQVLENKGIKLEDIELSSDAVVIESMLPGNDTDDFGI